MDFSEGLTFEMIGNVTNEELEEFNASQEVTFDSLVEKSNSSVVTVDGGNEDQEEEPLKGDSSEPVHDNQEGVGGDSQEGDDAEGKDGNSPNFYASIATSLRKDGILNLLDDTDFEDVSDGTSLASLFSKQIESMLDEKQRRISEALSSNIPPDVVKQYENAISYVESIQDENIREESADAENLRGNIIVQDYINKGFSVERANREAAKSFEAGTDVEDALLALKEMKQFYSEGYKSAVQEKKSLREKEIELERKKSKSIEKKFLETEEPIRGIKLNAAERDKLVKQYNTFVDKDEKGNPLNAIQKYANDNPEDYQYYINTLFYLTDGFKNLGKAMNTEIKNKTKSALNDLEKTLRNPNNIIGAGSGSLSFGNDKSPESFKGMTLALD